MEIMICNICTILSAVQVFTRNWEFNCFSSLILCSTCIVKNVQKWCKACVLLEGLNRGLPKLGIGRSRGLNNEQSKNIKQHNEAKSIESKQCGSLDF